MKNVVSPILKASVQLEVQKFINKWLSDDFASGKIIHVIPMIHHADVKAYQDHAEISQKKVYSILQSIQPDAVGIEGFCGDSYSIEAEARECLGYFKEAGVYDVSLKRLVKDSEKLIRKQKFTSRNFVLNNRVIGFGIEHPGLIKDSFLVSQGGFLEKFPHITEKIIFRDLTARTVYGIARCIKHSESHPSTIIALPTGSLHFEVIKALESEWKVNFIFHEEAIHF